MNDNYWNLVPIKRIDYTKYSGSGRPKKTDYWLDRGHFVTMPDPSDIKLSGEYKGIMWSTGK